MSIRVYDMVEDLSPRDKILTFMRSTRKDKIVLSESEQQYMMQVDYADDIMRAHPHMRTKELQNMICQKFPEVSASHARNVLLDAKYIHGTTQQPVKAYERQLITQMLYKVYEEAMNPKGIFDSQGEMLRPPAERNLTAAARALEIIAKINKLDTEEEETAANQGDGIVVIKPVFKPEVLGVELPENIDALISNLRDRTDVHRKANNMIKNADDGN